MVSFGNGLAAFLLLALTQSLARASLENDRNKTIALATSLARSQRFPWIQGVNSLARSSENSCSEEVAALVSAIQAGELWALHMVDASSKIQSGILKGNMRDLGTYDQCVAANGEYDDVSVQGKHCTITYAEGLLSSALCIPSSCNESQILDIVNEALENVPSIGDFDIDLEVSEVSCVEVDSEDFTTAEIATMIFFLTVAVFIIFCTICDCVKRSKSGRAPAILNTLAQFSLYTNGVALLSTKTNAQTMPAIQGIRFLSMCWVVLGHRYINTLLGPISNLYDVQTWFDSWTGVYIHTAPFAVDTFFVVSGFLMCYLFLKSRKSGKSFNLPMMYIHRYLRLTPCVAVLILFVAVLLHRVANGPVWSVIISGMVEPCQKNWWVNLLYVQNIVRPREICLAHSWYLAVDMQLFWISPIVLYPLHRWPKYGLGILGSAIVLSIVTPAVVLGLNSYSNALIDLNKTDMMSDFYDFYIPTYTRACAYFIGILMGYDVANKKRHLTRTTVVFNWIASCLLVLFCGWASHRAYSGSYDYNMTTEIIFAIILRPFWSIAMAWIIYACTHGHGGLATKFLSLPFFLPLSRLSYCIYLVHMVIQTAKITAVQTPVRFTDFNIVNEFWADLVTATVVAFIFSLFFESPLIVLEKILTGRGRVPSRNNRKDVEVGIQNKAMTEA